MDDRIIIKWLLLPEFQRSGKNNEEIKNYSARFGSTYTKIGTIQRRLAWPLHKDDTQIHEAVPYFLKAFAQQSKL